MPPHCTWPYPAKPACAGEPLPGEWTEMGAALTDEVTVTFTVTAVHKP